MPKLIQTSEEVTACQECRYIRHMGSHFLPRCSETPQKIEIPDASTIPDWCPLPDAPAPVERRCGTCRWWKLRVYTVEGRPVGGCQVPLAEWIELSDDCGNEMAEADGIDCPTWAAKDVERLEAEAGTPSDDYWDAHAYHCGNCDRALLTRGGRSKSVSPLSDPGQSEDEALCGSCAGADLYHVEAELDAALRENEIFAASRKEAMETVEALRAELIAALEEIAGTPPESLWQMQDPRMTYVTIQVDKKDYEAAQTRLTELEERT